MSMHPIRRSCATAAVSTLLLGLSACGGSPSGSVGAPLGAAAERSAQENKATSLSAQAEPPPADQATAAPLTTHRPEATASTGCGPEADEPVAADGGRAVEEAPDSGDDATELVPAERPQEASREAT
jgi:hypothetical protein